MANEVTYIQDMNLTQHQLLQAIIDKQNAPASGYGIEGQLVYDTSTKKAGYHNGTSWVWLDASALVNWTESNYTYSSKTGVKWTPNNAATNVDAVIQPKGTGSLLAQQPDGTTTGGDNRGSRAVDLQLLRSAADQVASGDNSVIAGGRHNKISVTDGSILGGNNNLVSGGAGVVIGGSNNTASGSNSVVLGGYQNTASGTSSLASGYGNTASGTSSLASGYGNTASGTSSLASGYGNTASGDYSVVLGNSSQALHANTVALGQYAITKRPYETITSYLKFGAAGDILYGVAQAQASVTIVNGTGGVVLKTAGNDYHILKDYETVIGQAFIIIKQVGLNDSTIYEGIILDFIAQRGSGVSNCKAYNMASSKYPTITTPKWKATAMPNNTFGGFYIYVEATTTVNATFNIAMSMHYNSFTRQMVQN